MKSTDKLKNYFENYTREKRFIDRIIQIRKDAGIPQNGIKFPDAPRYYTIEFPASVLGISYNNIKYPTYPAKMTAVYNELLSPLPKIYKEMETILFLKNLEVF